MRRGVLRLKNAILRQLAVPGLALLIGIGGALAQSGDVHAQDQSGKSAAAASADAEQESEPGGGEMGQNRILKLKHPSTHGFPDLLPARSRPDARV